MKTRLIATLLVAGMSLPAYSYYPASTCYAEEAEEAYIRASDLSFNSSETNPKKINFEMKGVDEKNLAFSFDSNGILSVNALGEVTPLDIGHTKVKIFDRTAADTVYAEITVSVWEDLLPDCPNISVTAESTDKTITVTNTTQNVPEGIVFEYSLNKYFWYETGTFTGLDPETTYSIYVRAKAKINDKYYILNPDAGAAMQIQTKPESSAQPEYIEKTMSPVTIREGNIYEVNLSSLKDYTITGTNSSDKNVAYPELKTVNGQRVLDIVAVKKGTANVSFTFDFSTDEKTKYITYIYPITVTEVPSLTFSLQPDHKNVKMVWDKSTVPEGYIVKFSFDQMNWQETDTLTRSYTKPQETVYGAFYDKDGYRRSIITSQKISDYYYITERDAVEDYQTDDIPINLEVGEEFHFNDKNGEFNKSYLQYTYESLDNKIATFQSFGKLIGLKPGTTTVKVTQTEYHFDPDGYHTVLNHTMIHQVTVTSSSTPTPSPSPTPSGDKDKDKDKDSKETITPTDDPYDDNLVLTVPDVTLSTSIYTYDGKVKTPELTVKAGGKTLSSKDYTAKWASGRKNVGRYYVTVSLNPSSGYSGSMKMYYYIKPAKVSIKKPARKGKNVTVKWKKGSPGITGYEITYIKGDTTKTVKVKGRNKTKKVIKAGKGYYVAVRAYKTVSGKTFYGKYSTIKKVK